MLEAASFMSTTLETSVVLDTMNADEMLRINFNISMLDLACHYATIDVYDLLGTNTQNVTKNVEKWHLDARGGRGRHRAASSRASQPESPRTRRAWTCWRKPTYVSWSEAGVVVENQQQISKGA